jgi:ribosome-binding protein aMBF1 (putative translation factor)
VRFAQLHGRLTFAKVKRKVRFMSDTPAPLSARELSRLRQIRLDEGWSFKTLAGRIGVTAPTVWRFLEREQPVMRSTTAHKFRRFLATYKSGRASAALTTSTGVRA